MKSAQGIYNTLKFKELPPPIGCRVILLLLAFLLLSTAAEARKVSITISNALVATYCDTVALDFRQSPVKAFGLHMDAGHLVRTPMPVVPARVGMLLTAPQAGTYEIPIFNENANANENTLPLEAAGNELVGTLERTPVPWISEDDSARNYILQSEGFRKATGAVLVAHKAYLHTDYDAEAAIDVQFDAMLQQELDSFRTELPPLWSRIPPLVYYLLGLAIGFILLYVYKRRRKS